MQNLREHPITQQMKKIAPDVVCIFNSYIERWQVYQIKQGSIMLPAGQKNINRVLMWTIQAADGSYRDPGSNDLMFLLKTVENSKKLWNGNADTIADEMDALTEKRESEIAGSTGEILRALARETGHLVKTTSKIQNAQAYADAAAADILGSAK